MTLIGKISSSVISFGLIGGGITAAYYSFNNDETISGRLEKEGFKILKPSSNNQDWNTVFKAYQKATENTFIGGKDSSLNEEGLRNKCKEILNKKSNNSFYLLAKQWCVKEKAVTEILNGLKLKLLSTEASTVEGSIKEVDKWKEKVKKYEQDSTDNKINVTLTGDDNAKATAMSKACKDLNIPELKTTSIGFNQKFEKIKKWCAIDKE